MQEQVRSGVDPMTVDQDPTAQAWEHARWEMAAMAGRLRALEGELAHWERRYDGLTRELQRERQRVSTLRSSESYRLGRAVVSFVKDPVRTSPRLMRGALRRLRGRAVAPTAASAPTARRRAPQRLPVHLYVAIGLDPDTLRAFVRTVSQRVLVDADHVPVVVTDSPTFSLLRSFGVVLEYVPDRDTWQRHRDDLAFDEMLTQRLARLFRDHGCVRTVIVDRHDPPGLAQLIAMDATVG